MFDQRDTPRHPRRLLPSITDARLWLLAVLLFGVGDVATTAYFIEIGVASEANPVGVFLLNYGYIWLAIWKAAVFGVFYLLYRLSPRTMRAGVPVGLVLLGGFITAWNTYISVTGTYPYPF